MPTVAAFGRVATLYPVADIELKSGTLLGSRDARPSASRNRSHCGVRHEQ